MVQVQLPLPFSLGPLVKRSRHRPFTAVTGVRFPHGSPLGSLAQLGEHLPYKQRVSGSSPLTSTTKTTHESEWFFFLPLETTGFSGARVSSAIRPVWAGGFSLEIKRGVALCGARGAARSRRPQTANPPLRFSGKLSARKGTNTLARFEYPTQPVLRNAARIGRTACAVRASQRVGAGIACVAVKPPQLHINYVCVTPTYTV